MKFKGVLFAQKVNLTEPEYDTLIEAFKTENPTLINYKQFEDHIERIFVEPELEK
jgi:hypothetical protein